MASVEERLAKVEREIERLQAIRATNKAWPIAQIDEKYRGDEVLEEIFRLGKEERDADRKKELD